jgi:hypothetical protein
VCPSCQLLNQFDDFHQTSYERYAIGGHVSVMLSDLLQSIGQYGGYANICDGSDIGDNYVKKR